MTIISRIMLRKYLLGHQWDVKFTSWTVKLVIVRIHLMEIMSGMSMQITMIFCIMMQ